MTQSKTDPNVPKKRVSPNEWASRQPKSLRLAINAMCYQCQGEDAGPSFQWRIGNCEIPTCGLFKVRPFQNMKGNPTPRGLKCN